MNLNARYHQIVEPHAKTIDINQGPKEKTEPTKTAATWVHKGSANNKNKRYKSAIAKTNNSSYRKSEARTNSSFRKTAARSISGPK